MAKSVSDSSDLFGAYYSLGFNTDNSKERQMLMQFQKAPAKQACT